ncbi:FG-GAP repeat domain-containing protein [Bowmanella dokdonensis]|uniref:VCBS repeat-containing protein n=1 Tax=Bowmanella dokdonensis TaxID=751969 RepID=A0A939ITR8_9ALTE|nr:VCBS repeat-containing protein [Bowmanella dokdonensis]MBN7827731.1 VCBS repeat-containing protein [Bowmanella dokdonensis]
MKGNSYCKAFIALFASFLIGISSQASTWSDESHQQLFGDFNGDDWPDTLLLAKESINTSSYSLLQWQDGSISYGDAIELTDLPLVDMQRKAVIGDLNGDGLDDVLVVAESGEIHLIFGNHSGILSLQNATASGLALPASFDNLEMISGNFDSNNTDEVVVWNKSSNVISLFAVEALETVIEVTFRQSLSVSSNNWTLKVRDYDDDGQDDLLLLSTVTNQPHQLWLSNEIGQLIPQSSESPTPKLARYNWDPSWYSTLYLRLEANGPLFLARRHSSGGGFNEFGELSDPNGEPIADGVPHEAETCKDLLFSPLTREFSEICLAETSLISETSQFPQPDCPPLQGFPAGSSQPADDCYEPPITPNSPPTIIGGNFQPIKAAYTIKANPVFSGSRLIEWVEIYESSSPNTGYTKIFGGPYQGSQTTRSHSTYGYRYYKFKMCSYHECSSPSPYQRVYVYTSPGPVQNLTVSPPTLYLNGSATLSWNSAGG